VLFRSGSIVFIYLNHGSPTALGLPAGEITTGEMMAFCQLACKPFLVVLDACHSTEFARLTIQDLTTVHAKADVGFLTSADGTCYTSAILIAPHDPTLLPNSNGVTYKINHSMFSRAFLLQLAYKLGRDDPTLLTAFPSRLNSHGEPMKNGFEASFQCYGTVMAHRTVRFFFPWAPVDPQALSLVNPTAQFAQVIPREDIGNLFDDIGRLWHGVGSERGYEDAFYELEDGPKGIQITRSGRLSPTDPMENEIRQHIEKHRGNPLSELHTTSPGYVSIHRIADEVVTELLELQGGTVQPGRDEVWCDELAHFIIALNGELPIGRFRDIWRIYDVSVHVNHEECKQLIRAARERIAASENIPIE
jgi:hypothetical protein